MKINLFSVLKHPQLIPYIWRWQYGRFARHFSFLPRAYAPFEKYKITDDKIIYDLLINALEKKIPLMMGRYGSSEYNAMQNTLLCQKGIFSSFPTQTYKELCINAGFFPYTTSSKEISLFWRGGGGWSFSTLCFKLQQTVMYLELGMDILDLRSIL
ncbi:hypothetical protein [Helicobacter cholecystus]|uniref:hypothetical protein n=1 Tax=Helicobacter cholecystus TaxID=45498 RepID=UPI002739D130|nr:hypothetical protein [Helicobacter cholecystus]